jgi:hypothetical protein
VVDLRAGALVNLKHMPTYPTGMAFVEDEWID